MGLTPSPARAAVIDFTGGTVYLFGGGTATTTNGPNYAGVDYYEESGFKLDFIDGGGPGGFPTNVGDYYGVGNDVIHAHWSTGDFGDVTGIEITKIGGGTFDLNYFILTSNTDTGGSVASGLEVAWIEGFNANVSTGAAIMLPPENWGFPAVQIFLGSQFDSVDLVKFYVTNAVDCFGMDEFYIDEAAPGAVPEPSTLLLAAAGLAILARRRFKKSA